MSNSVLLAAMQLRGMRRVAGRSLHIIITAAEYSIRMCQTPPRRRRQETRKDMHFSFRLFIQFRRRKRNWHAGQLPYPVCD